MTERETDLVERGRRMASQLDMIQCEIVLQMADAIERLRAPVDGDVLKKAADIIESHRSVCSSEEIADALAEFGLLRAPVGDAATMREACARLIEETQEVLSSGPGKDDARELMPRKYGNLMGIAYAAGIRALPLPVSSDPSAKLRIEIRALASANSAALNDPAKIASDIEEKSGMHVEPGWVKDGER